jgi:hypothetical protein
MVVAYLQIMSDLFCPYPYFRALCRALSAVLGCAILLATIFLDTPIRAQRYPADSLTVIAAYSDASATGRAVTDHNAQSVCSPGIGCSAFTVPAEATLGLATFNEAIWCVGVTKLVTGILAPPAPPPNIIILV